jgi:dTDP-4-amino-4,6-dideoxygalactose transaminase
MKALPKEIFNQDNCSFFALGRNAIYSVCKSLDLGEGDIVLSPVFDCDSTLNPYRVLGLSFDFYKSDPYTFEVDIQDLRSRINKKVKLIHIINHFGFPQPWDALLKLREETGIPIIEDNAFTLFSKYNGRMLGTFGDFSFFSLYKMIPLIDGGMLRINNPEYSIELPDRKPKWFYRPERKKVLSLIATKLGVMNLPLVVRDKLVSKTTPLSPLNSDKPGYPEWNHRDEILDTFSCDYYRPMSKLAKTQLRNYPIKDYAVLNKSIRYFYQFIVEKLEGMDGVQVLWRQIPEEVTPTCVTILLSTHRDDILKALKAKRFSVMAWPTYSGDVIDRTAEYPEIEIMGKQILQLMIPIHRVIRSDANKYFKNLVEEFINLKRSVR